MACEVHQHLISKGINLVLETRTQAINEAGNKLTVTLNNQTVDTDMVIMAIWIFLPIIYSVCRRKTN